MTEALAEQWGMPVINLPETTISPKVLEVVPQTMADIYDSYLSSPVVVDGVVYFGSGDSHVYAVDAATGFITGPCNYRAVSSSA